MKAAKYILPVDGSTCKMLLYGYIGSNNDEENIVEGKTFVSELAQAERDYETINIHINSAGGDVYEGLAIFNAIRNSTKNIILHIDGIAASMAGIIAICGKPLYMNKYSLLMIHRVTGTGQGNADDMTRAAEDMKRVEDMLINILNDRMKLPEPMVKEQYFDGKNHWMTADDALRNNLISGIYEGVKVDFPEGFRTDNNFSAAMPRAIDHIISQFNNLLTSNVTMKNLLKKLGLKNEADEQEAIDAFEALQVKADQEKARADAAEQKVNDLEAKLTGYIQKEQQAHDAEIDNIIADAVKKGKLQDGQKASFKAILQKDFENGKAVLNSINPVHRMVNLLNGPEKDQYNGWNFSDFQKKAPKVLAERKATDPEWFKALYKAEFGKEPKI